MDVIEAPRCPARCVVWHPNRRESGGHKSSAPVTVEPGAQMPGTDVLRACRKQAVDAREAWASLQKAWRGQPDLARFAKAWVRLWGRREKALTLVIRREEGLAMDTYDWPPELAEDMDWGLNEAWLIESSPEPDPSRSRRRSGDQTGKVSPEPDPSRNEVERGS